MVERVIGRVGRMSGKRRLQPFVRALVPQEGALS